MLIYRAGFSLSERHDEIRRVVLTRTNVAILGEMSDDVVHRSLIEDASILPMQS